MGFFTKDKEIDGFKKINKIVMKMYYIKKTLILKCSSFTESDRQEVAKQLDSLLDACQAFIHLNYKQPYMEMMVMESDVVDYECQRMRIKDFIPKVTNEINMIKRICKGATPEMSQINPNSIPRDFFFDEHNLGVIDSIFNVGGNHMEFPPMVIV